MPDDIVAKLIITMNDQGLCTVAGYGGALTNKAFAYGLLELAKDVLRAEARVAPAHPSDISRFTQ